jgi:hypothetical protein
MKKTYAIALDRVKLLADVIAQLDYIKNFLPSGCKALAESEYLVNQGHAVLTKLLGADECLVYSPIEEETTA